MSISADATTRVGTRVREHFWNLPNAVTLARIAGVPLLLLLLAFPGQGGSLAMGIVFLGISLTDFADGWLARRYQSVTRVGKLLDPLADKLLVLTAFVVLLALPDRLPLWTVPLVVVILGREMAVTALRALASAEGVLVPEVPLAKWKTGFQIAALTALILHQPLAGLPTHRLGLCLLVVATGLTAASGWSYFAGYLALREPR
jgi:CDP-diacylglycerol--glycerol-3-phosphate 3-phosphatidyltransferase